MPAQVLPLNPREEDFCHAVIEEKSIAKAYSKAYPNSSYNAARSSAPVVLARPAVQNRIRELMERNSILRPRSVVGRLADHVSSSIPHISLDATKFAFKIYGADVHEREGSTQNQTNILVNLDGKTASEVSAAISQYLMKR